MSHGGGDDDDIGASAWPGFVDILSSVLIMFVFFLMITAIALNFHIMMYKSKLKQASEQIIAQKVKEELDKSDKDLAQENQDLKSQVDQLKKQISSVTDASNKRLEDMSESKQLTSEVNDKEKTLVIYFDQNAVTINDETNQVIQKFLDPYKSSAKMINIMSSRSLTERIDTVSRKISISRMLNVRNSLINAKVEPSKINAYMVDGQTVDDKENWVKIVVKE